MDPNYIVTEQNETSITITDIGPWDRHTTITNGAETVVAEMSHLLQGRRLFYIDSEGERGELLVKAGKFAGFGNAA